MPPSRAPLDIDRFFEAMNARAPRDAATLLGEAVAKFHSGVPVFARLASDRGNDPA